MSRESARPGTVTIAASADRSDPRPRLAYVIPHLSAEESDHFAHIPGLLAALGADVDVAAVVERGDPPARLDGVRLLIRVPGRGRLGRIAGTARTVHRCARAGYRTYFLRYSRLFVAVLILTYPIYRHRILMWRSGTADLLEPGRRRPLGARFENAVNWLTARLVHNFVTGPETMVTVMASRWNVPRQKMRLLYNDVDAERFVPLSPEVRATVRARRGWGEKDFVLLYVHRLSHRRGTRLLAPILNALLGTADSGAASVRLVVAGDGPDRSRLEREADDPALDGRMQVLGAVPNRDLPALYAAADCLVMPSYEEGFPRVLLEAMATATPIVTTDAGGSADVVGTDYPYVARVGDLDGLVSHVRALMAVSDAERQQLGWRLRHRAEREYSPQRAAAMLAELL
ncbi:glycosyltransferase family 4 protein [Micromonospora sp. NPDC003776]